MLGSELVRNEAFNLTNTAYDKNVYLGFGFRHFELGHTAAFNKTTKPLQQ